MDTRYLNKEFMMNFLELYKSHSCLWKVDSKDYKNRYLKTKAYEELVELCKKIYDKADKNFVVKKIQAIRGSFRKEFKKVEQSKRSGIADKLYSSKLWYYDLLLFTKDEETPNESLNNETYEDSETTEEGDFHENPENLTADKNEEENDTSEVQETTPRQRSVYTNSAAKKRRKTEEERSTFLNTCTRVFTTDEDEYTAFGITVAAKLRKMDENQKVYAENVINQVLFKGQLKKLCETSTVTDTACPNEHDIVTSPYASSSTNSETATHYCENFHMM
ncbi:uncharacterized protein LOC142329169 isoform X26 [Lycorma delicatula]|uniref:uncharacterized protein LOC142329169 isoform X26 n=1 Tax=Lycorma delicatula TaxID=130591 RepID=UPI003F5134C1